jgi:hypothetical protein
MLKVTDIYSVCHSLFDTVIVALEGGPLGVTISQPQDTICKGESTTITAYGFGGNYHDDYTYTWYLGTGFLKEETSPVSTLVVSPDDNGEYIYTVKIYDGYNEYSENITLFVAPTPEFNILGGPQIIACPTDTVLLKPNSSFTLADYYWSNGATEPSILIGTTGIGFSIRTLKLTITNQDGCQYSDSITVVFDFAACFGIDEYESFPYVKIFPNPTTGQINVELEDGEGFSALQILNMQGTLVYQKELKSLLPGPNLITADLSGFPRGVYLIKAIHDHFLHLQKVVLN